MTTSNQRRFYIIWQKSLGFQKSLFSFRRTLAEELFFLCCDVTVENRCTKEWNTCVGQVYVRHYEITETAIQFNSKSEMIKKNYNRINWKFASCSTPWFALSIHLPGLKKKTKLILDFIMQSLGHCHSQLNLAKYHVGLGKESQREKKAFFFCLNSPPLPHCTQFGQFVSLFKE